MFWLYLDPGSGSFLLQLLIAGIAALGLGIGTQWARIKRFFNKNKAQAKSADDEDDEDYVDAPVATAAASAAEPTRTHSAHLPVKCPTCGAAVRPNEVKWLDEITIECQYCGVPIKVNPK